MMPQRNILILCAALLYYSCGEDSSNNSGPDVSNEISSSEQVGVPSLSSSDDSINLKSSSSAKFGDTSSSKAKSSSSGKSDNSSSSKAKSSSSGKSDNSSSSKTKSSSSGKSDNSSSSKTKSSSSIKSINSSSSEVGSSLGVESGNSSSSEASCSSNVKPDESSSSEFSSSSSVMQSSSSSLEATGVCKTKTEDNCIYGSLYDERDGKTYKTVKIGEQEWMAENLGYVDSSQSVCYANNPDNCQIYGRLYDRNGAINDCPEGWRLPSEKDWIDLRNFAKKNSSNKYIGQLFRADTLWDVNGIGLGYNAFGFSALPAGVSDDDGWWGLNKHALFWMDGSFKNGTMDCYVFTWIRYNENNNSDMRIGKTDKLCEQNPDSYFSVRCIKD